jgi:hypothetical protein
VIDLVPAELETLVYWIHERDRIRAAKERGASKPWTTDPLLRDYRWCNVRRMDDRVSRELFDRWYPKASSWRGAELDFALFARLVNWPDALDEIVGHLDCARVVLTARAERGDKVFTGAYVVPGVPGKNKVDSICDLITKISTQDLYLLRPTMRGTWEQLIRFDGIGSFLAGQVVADLAHLRAGREWPDRDTWAPLGPGSARGLNRLRGIAKDKAVSQAEFEELLPKLIVRLRPRISDVWLDRGLQAMDVQNCLCEFDKYRRLQLAEGKVRARYSGAGDAQAALL